MLCFDRLANMKIRLQAQKSGIIFCPIFCHLGKRGVFPLREFLVNPRNLSSPPVFWMAASPLPGRLPRVSFVKSCNYFNRPTKIIAKEKTARKEEKKEGAEAVAMVLVLLFLSMVVDAMNQRRSRVC